MKDKLNSRSEGVKAKNPVSLKKFLVTHEFAPFRGGAAVYGEEVVRAARARGLEVGVVAAARASLRPGPLLAFAARVLGARRRMRGARVVLGSVGAHLVFLHLDLAGFFRDAEVTPLFHGSEVFRFQRNRWLRWAARRWLAARPRIAATSPYVRDLVRESGLLPPGKEVVLAPCAVRADLRAAAERTPPPPPDPEGRVRVLTLARLHPRKGQLETARALAALPEAVRRGLVYQVGGTGDRAYLHEVERTCTEGGVPFVFLGEVPEARLAETYAGCDLYVMASRTLARSVEGFGMTYLEAGLFGKPVVGTRTGGVASAVIDGETGLLVPEGDGPALTGALRRLVEDAALRARLGEGNRAFALRHDWAETARVLFGE